jgi:hypothetical protein
MKPKPIKARRMWTNSTMTRIDRVCINRIREDGTFVPLDIPVAVIDVSDREKLIEQVKLALDWEDGTGAGCDWLAARVVMALGLLPKRSFDVHGSLKPRKSGKQP